MGVIDDGSLRFGRPVNAIVSAPVRFRSRGTWKVCGCRGADKDGLSFAIFASLREKKEFSRKDAKFTQRTPRKPYNPYQSGDIGKIDVFIVLSGDSLQVSLLATCQRIARLALIADLGHSGGSFPCGSYITMPRVTRARRSRAGPPVIHKASPTTGKSAASSGTARSLSGSRG
jgi:hypothetical protein